MYSDKLSKRKTFKFKFIKKNWKKKNLLKFGVLGLVFLKTIIFFNWNFSFFVDSIKNEFKFIKTQSKIWNNLSFSFNIYKKSKGARMGKGKGKFTKSKSIYIRKGDIIFEFFIWSFRVLKLILRKLKKKIKYPLSILKF